MTHDQTKQSMLFYINNLISQPIGDEMKGSLAGWIADYWERLFNAQCPDHVCSFRGGEDIAAKMIRTALQNETIVDITQRGYEPLFDSICDLFHIPAEFQPPLRFYFVMEKYRPMIDFYRDIVQNNDDRRYLGFSRIMSYITNTSESVIKKAAARSSSDGSLLIYTFPNAKFC
ncbi:hypothetical protein AGMMS49521_2150 [Campylobacterota bacterium]|nr:hypothetical protein AGMMS49521_2150 [Campylobacterota bacterium]